MREDTNLSTVYTYFVWVKYNWKWNIFCEKGGTWKSKVLRYL